MKISEKRLRKIISEMIDLMKLGKGVYNADPIPKAQEVSTDPFERFVPLFKKYRTYYADLIGGKSDFWIADHFSKHPRKMLASNDFLMFHNYLELEKERNKKERETQIPKTATGAGRMMFEKRKK